MPDCGAIDSLVTPYVDGELAGSSLATVERHLAICPACQGRVTTERAVRGLLRERHAAFKGECAPPQLLSRCQGHCQRLPLSPGTASAWWQRLAPLAAAALLVVAVGGVLLYVGTVRSNRLLAAELTADHIKCFTLNAALGTHETAEDVEQALADDFDWRVDLPAGLEAQGLELVGARPCLYGGGRVAHVMYRHRGSPVSLFMLPGTVRREGLVESLGHECAIWSDRSRTFVLIARESRDDVERLVALAQAALH